MADPPSAAKGSRWRDSTLVIVLTIILTILVLRVFARYNAPVLAKEGIAVVAGFCFVVAGAGTWLWKRFFG